jgi:hypothetical protein
LVTKSDLGSGAAEYGLQISKYLQFLKKKKRRKISGASPRLHLQMLQSENFVSKGRCSSDYLQRARNSDCLQRTVFLRLSPKGEELRLSPKDGVFWRRTPTPNNVSPDKELRLMKTVFPIKNSRAEPRVPFVKSNSRLGGCPIGRTCSVRTNRINLEDTQSASRPRSN